MLSKESDKIKCRKCNGKGYTRILKPNLEHKNIGISIDTEFKFICMFCLGLGKVDWIQAITGNKSTSTKKHFGESFLLMYWIDKKLPRGNWAYVHHGSLYYIYEKFFDEHKYIKDKMKNFIISFDDKILYN